MLSARECQNGMFSTIMLPRVRVERVRIDRVRVESG